MDINLDYAKAAKLLLPAAETITLALVGCGGTGSWLAPAVVRVARLLKEAAKTDVKVYFIDPDQVEAKNVYRQNFCDAEVGKNKADALAFRLGLAWGVEITVLPDKFKERVFPYIHDNLTVLIGCVDNAEARLTMAQACRGNMEARWWWLDCGNHNAAGQVLLGSGHQSKRDPFELPGFCSWLPLPTKWAPELLEDATLPTADFSGLSCADMALVDAQGLAINQRMAAEAADYLARMLLTKDLRKFATYIDLASGATKSRYITEEAIQWKRAEK